MNLVGGIIIFILWWWISFFAILPMGVTARWEADHDGVEGAEPGAPTNPDLKRKALHATIASVVLTGVTAAIILSGVINFRE